MCREFKSRRIRIVLFSSVHAGGNKNDYETVPLRTSIDWPGEGPGNQCYKVGKIS